MSTDRYELTGLGNAIVDVIGTESDDFLNVQGITKGAMTLIDETRAQKLYTAIGPAKAVSGGSAANTLAGFASLGGYGAYLGKVANDQLGEIFAHDIKAIGVHFMTTPLRDGPKTARCIIVVTPDAQRSMSTYLGASVEFGEADVNEQIIRNSSMIYLEGYLFDKDPAKRAFLKAAHLAHGAGARVALTLSDSFCVERHRSDFTRLVEQETDVLFANENEIKALYQTKSFDDAVRAVRGHCDIAIITRSEKGSVVLQGDQTFEIKAAPVNKVVDTTGAGDQYAAGFLFGLARNLDIPTCGALGSLAAGEVISHVGPRPETSLAQLAKEKLGLKLAA